jgi:hypothetical protein
MARGLRRFMTLRGPLRQWSAALLLLVFVTDVGFHLASSLLAGPEEIVSTQIRSGPGHRANPEQHDPGCGIPGHSGTPFHHHHFPAVIPQSSVVVPQVSLAWVLAVLPPEAVHISLFSTPVRAPPFGF